jgi:hypothetical protein
MKEIPIIMSVGQTRMPLINQTLETFYRNTTYPHKLYIFGDNISYGCGAHHIEIRNRLIKEVKKDAEFVVSLDDDLFFNPGWLEALVSAHRNNPDLWVLSGCLYEKHIVYEERADVIVTSGFLGGCCCLFDQYLKKYDGLPLQWTWDRRISELLDHKHIGRLKDDTKVIHAGIKRHDGYVYNGEWVERVQELAKEYGVILA